MVVRAGRGENFSLRLGASIESSRLPLVGSGSGDFCDVGVAGLKCRGDVEDRDKLSTVVYYVQLE